MTTSQITQKAAKTTSTCVIAVPYCFLQHALNYESRFAYNSGRDGWNFDLFKLNEKYSIVTGYRGMNRASTHNLLASTWPELKQALVELEQECVGPELDRKARKAKLIALLESRLPC